MRPLPEPCRELDALIHEGLFGAVLRLPSGPIAAGKPIPWYSSSIDAAMEFAQSLLPGGRLSLLHGEDEIVIELATRDGRGQAVSFAEEFSADASMASAIMEVCLLALLIRTGQPDPGAALMALVEEGADAGPRAQFLRCFEMLAAEVSTNASLPAA